MKLRDYQVDVFNKIRIAISKGNKKILVNAPTAFGKTILAREIAKNANDKGNRVLFTAHRITLAEQTVEKFHGLKPELLQGDNKIKNENSLLIVATIQTLINSDIKEPKIIIIDEVHYAYEGQLIQSLFERFPDAIFIGLSATPVDGNDYLLDGFDVILDDYQTEDLIKLGYLTPFKCFAPFTIDVSKVRVTSDDYNQKELEQTVNKADINDSVVEQYLKHGEQRPFIAFAVNQAHCKDLKKAFNDKGVKCEFVVANTPKLKRDKYFKQLNDGDIKGLISIEILTAGFDMPIVSCIVLAMATQQWKKYIQCAGRGIRLQGQTIKESIENGKPNCLLLDFCGNIERHGLPDERKNFRFGKKISKVLDRELGLDKDNELRQNISEDISEEKQIYLKQIGSLLDLYDGKIYKSESDLQADINNYLKRTGYFYWRQNSGRAFMQGRWVHFASKAGLPDNTVFYDMTSLYFGLELKLKGGSLTQKQKETLPEMTANRVLFFFAESVYDVYLIIEHIENNVIYTDEGLLIKNSVYSLPEKQLKYRERFKLDNYSVKDI